MKAIKKVFALLLTAAMVLGMATTALAEGETGSITIDNAVKDYTYSIYRVFDLTVDNVDNPSAYKYTLNSSWSGLASYSTTIDEETVSASNFFTVDSTDGHIVWSSDKNNDAGAAAFAKLLDAYQKEYKVTAVDSKKATSSTLTFDNLDLGYYFVQTTLGALCSLDTTNPTATIKEKNSAPSVDKQVQEGSSWGDVNDVNIGDTVNFQTTINVIDGDPKNYVLHDVMSAGLTFGSVTGVTVNDTSIGTTATDNAAYYTVNFNPNDKCTFEVSFTNLKPNDVIVVSYTATVNENATVAGDGNTNKTKLDYGDDGATTWDTTTTYTWEFDILKYTGTTTNTLSGATFTLSKNSDGSNPIKLVAVVGKTNTYRVATTSDTDTVTSFTTDSSGKIYIEGLDSGTYYLTETAAPSGYNMLTAPVKVVIDGDGNVYVDDSTTAATNGLVEVENKTGTELPSTGGIGTTIFYVIGSVLVIGAAVLLITKKRMSGTQE